MPDGNLGTPERPRSRARAPALTCARMPARVLHAGDAFWRPSNQMGVLNCDLGKQLEAATLAARFWRLLPGQASTKHRHTTQTELYVVLEGTGRMRIGERRAAHAGAAVERLVEPGDVRQVFNDTDADALWLVVGTPPELANTLEMTAAAARAACTRTARRRCRPSSPAIEPTRARRGRGRDARARPTRPPSRSRPRRPSRRRRRRQMASSANPMFETSMTNPLLLSAFVRPLSRCAPRSRSWRAAGDSRLRAANTNPATLGEAMIE